MTRLGIHARARLEQAVEIRGFLFTIYAQEAALNGAILLSLGLARTRIYMSRVIIELLAGKAMVGRR